MAAKIEIDSLKELTHKKIHEGLNGTCYLTKDKYIFKMLNNPNEKNLIDLSKFNSTHFVFPRVLVYSKDGVLLGYLMEYAKGDTLDKLPHFVSLENYKTELLGIEREIEVLTCYRLFLHDMGKTNILYTEKHGMSVVDTDFYVPNSTSKHLYQDNMIQFARGCMYPFGDLTLIHFNKEQLNKYAKLIIEGKMKPTDFIYELEREIIKNGYDQPKSIKELNKRMKLI